MMGFPVTYLLKTILLAGVFYGYYCLALRGGRFHRWNRWYLLGAVACALLVPLGHWPSAFSAGGSTGSLGIMRLRAFTFRASGSGSASAWPVVWRIAYGAVCLGMLIPVIGGLARLFRRARPAQRLPLEGFTLVTGDFGTPFSFFRYVFWPAGLPVCSSEGRRILTHELTHVRQGHSVDKLVLELINVFFWVNPFFFLMRKELGLVHEFLADEASCRREERADYATLLVSGVLSPRFPGVASPFFHRELTRRVRMLLGTTALRRTWLRRAGCVPVVLMASVFVLLQESRGNAKTALLAARFMPVEQLQDPAASPKKEVVPVFSRAQKALTVATEDSSSAQVQPPPLPPPPPPPRPAGPGSPEAMTGYPASAASGDDKIFSFVEHMPSFPGGEDALMQYLSAHIRYPKVARENGIMGTVVVQFDVDKQGYISHVTTVGARKGGGLEEEAIRVTSEMPRWKPGMQNGHKVNVRYALPIRFVLQ